MTRVALHTIGCKLNFAETSAMGKQFLERGFQVVPWGDPAEVVVLNTCTVTERADRECRQLIRRALRARGGSADAPQPFVIVTGCYAQMKPEAIASIRGVDLVLGTTEKSDLFSYAGGFRKGEGPKIHITEAGTLERFGPAFTTQAGGRTRAFLKIQDGCDYTCSFCTIPMARGPSRSQSVDLCVSQAEELIAQGYREIVLTGVNVGDYGRKSGQNLLGLLKELVGVQGLDRIRISSIEPNLLTRELIEFVAAEPVLCKHFHIPLQSGSDEVLRSMRRRYQSGAYRDLVRLVRSVLPEAGIGVDVIVGFPGETDGDFAATQAFLAELPISYLHVFTYSERPDTPASTMAAQVEPRTRQRRNAALRTLSREKRTAFMRTMLTRTWGVLLEGESENGLRFGFTDNYIRVGVPADAAGQNTLVPVRLEEIAGEICLGSVTGGAR